MKQTRNIMKLLFAAMMAWPFAHGIALAQDTNAAPAEPAAAIVQPEQPVAPVGPPQPTVPTVPTVPMVLMVPPVLEVAAVEVIEAGDSCTMRIAAMLGYTPATPAQADAGQCNWLTAGVDGNKQEHQILIGAGDVVAVVQAETYDAAIRYQQAGQHTLHLFFNGFNVTEDAELLAAERYGSYYFLRYHLKPGAQSRQLWAAMIRGNNSMVTANRLSVSYGWSSAEPNSTIRAGGLIGPARLAVTSKARLWLAGGVTLVVAMAGWLLALTTSVLRDPSPPNPNGNGNGEAFARTMPYSLSRVQLFSWFMFALLSGIFLKLMYTELPQLDGSVLTLLGISTGTGALSWTIGKPTLETPGSGSGKPTQSFLLDLVTGPDGDYQVHRVQAVLVNITLLLIGVFHVVTSIAYPTFDQSWLIFLTISGGTYAFGKQLAETPQAKPAAAGVTVQG